MVCTLSITSQNLLQQRRWYQLSTHTSLVITYGNSWCYLLYVAELTVQQSWDESSYSSCFIVQGRAGYGCEFSSHLTGKSVKHLFSVLGILSQSQVIVCLWEIQVRKVGCWQPRNFNLGNCSCWFLSYAEKSKTADCIYPVCLGVPRTVLKQKKTSGCHQFLSL